jgi:hypothetical protein
VARARPASWALERSSTSSVRMAARGRRSIVQAVYPTSKNPGRATDHSTTPL